MLDDFFMQGIPGEESVMQHCLAFNCEFPKEIMQVRVSYDCTCQAAYSGYRSRTSTRRAELNRRVPSTARCRLARNSARKN